MSTDDIGDRGQAMFVLLFTDFCGRDQPLFRPRFLGDKFPTFDYIIELVDHPSLYFFIQVKTTDEGYTKIENRLKVQLSQAHIDRMVDCPAPTYLVGIDEQTGIGFLLSINEARDHVPSMSTRFRIDCSVLGDLYDEVYSYWTSRSMQLSGSRFRE